MSQTHLFADDALRIAQLLRGMGKIVIGVNDSINRHGQHSSYIDIGRFIFRISDHASSRTDAIDISNDCSGEDLVNWFKDDNKFQEECNRKRQDDENALISREALYIDEIKSANDENLHKICSKIYPGMAGPAGKNCRRQVIQKWKSRYM